MHKPSIQEQRQQRQTNTCALYSADISTRFMDLRVNALQHEVLVVANRLLTAGTFSYGSN